MMLRRCSVWLGYHACDIGSKWSLFTYLDYLAIPRATAKRFVKIEAPLSVFILTSFSVREPGRTKSYNPMILQATHSEKLKWASYGILLIASIFSFLRCWFYEPIDDDLVYQFVLDEQYGSKYYTDHVSSFSDAIASQTQEYFSHSGRFLVHVITQMFCGVWGRDLFCIMNAIVVFISLCMLLKYDKTMKINTRLFLAVLLAVVSAYILPFKLNISIAHSLNYIWPLPFVLLYIFACSRCRKDICIPKEKNNRTGKRSFNCIRCVLLGILGFVTGSTQETYVLPLCVVSFGILCYWLVRRRHLSLDLMVLFFSLWIGGAFLGLAPGTLNRGGGLSSAGIVLTIYDGVKMLVQQQLFWLAVILLVINVIQNHSLKTTIWNLRVELSLMCVSVVFTVLAHTTMQSFSGVQFFSLLVSIRLANACLSHLNKVSFGILEYVSWGIFGLFVIHQGMVAASAVKMYKYNHDLIERYVASPDGVVFYDRADPVPLTAWCVRDFSKTLSGPYADWMRYTVTLAYGNEKKPICLFNRSDYRILSKGLQDPHTESFDSGSYFFKLSGSVVAVDDSLQLHGDSVIIGYKSTKELNKLYSCFLNLTGRKKNYRSSWVISMPVDSIELLKTRWGNYRIIKYPQNASIESITLK